jgi:hypothetical protein
MHQLLLLQTSKHVRPHALCLLLLLLGSPCSCLQVVCGACKVPKVTIVTKVTWVLHTGVKRLLVTTQPPSSHPLLLLLLLACGCSQGFTRSTS